MIIQAKNANIIVNSLSQEKLQNPLLQALECKDKYGAEMVQFLLNVNNEWELNYILTNMGEVIGTKASFLRRPKQFELPVPESLNQPQNDQSKRISSSRNKVNKKHSMKKNEDRKRRH